MFRKMKSPLEADWASNVVPRVSLINVIVAPGITEPCVSFTLPATVAVACADADAVKPSTKTVIAARTRPLNPRMDPSRENRISSDENSVGSPHRNMAGNANQFNLWELPSRISIAVDSGTRMMLAVTFARVEISNIDADYTRRTGGVKSPLSGESWHS